MVASATEIHIKKNDYVFSKVDMFPPEFWSSCAWKILHFWYDFIKSSS